MRLSACRASFEIEREVCLQRVGGSRLRSLQSNCFRFRAYSPKKVFIKSVIGVQSSVSQLHDKYSIAALCEHIITPTV